MSRRVHIISWLIGVAALAGVVWYFRPAHFFSSLQMVGVGGAAAWLAATMIARLLFAEVPTSLLRELDYRISRTQVFLIGWLRTFSNQIMPMTGLAVYLQQVRDKSGASWQDLAASSSQQLFIGAAALGVIGLSAGLSNLTVLGDALLPLLLVFFVLSGVALAAALGVSRVIRSLPRIVSQPVSAASDSFGRLASNPKLIVSLIGLHAVATLLRGIRIWLLFGSVGAGLSWQEALLIVALAEATVLIPITPGGLGVREGIIIGGAALLNIPTDVAVTVSLIDRLFVVAVTGMMAAPAAIHLYRKPSRGSIQK